MRAVLASAAHAREHLVRERAEVVEQTQDLGLGVGEGAHAGVHHLDITSVNIYVYLKLPWEKFNEENNKIIYAVNMLAPQCGPT